VSLRPAPIPVIRDATLADRDAIVEFNRRLALETEHKTLDVDVLRRGVTRALTDAGLLRYWVAQIDHAGDRLIIGQTAISLEWSDWRDGWIWWLQSVYVHPDYRGRGIFKALYRHVHAQALAAPDVIGLRLYVENANELARQTYQSLGMKPGGYSVLEELWLDRNRPSS
jgi:GNAT superfamily N-acetyltransferase